MRNKQKKPSKYAGKYRNYSADQLLKAYNAVKDNKMPVKKAAREFGIPCQTLRDRVIGLVDPGNFQRDTVLSHEEEEAVVEYAESRARLGYGLTNTGLQRIAGEIVHKMGKRGSDKPLSNCWLYGFLGRWSARINSVKPSALESFRAKATTPENVSAYFGNLEETLTRLELNEKPEFIFNLDETGVSPEHRPPNVIAPRNEKAQSVTSPRSGTTTVIACANAAGCHIPPYFVFKGKRVNPELMNGTSAGSRSMMSDSGWSTAAVFRDYLEHHFLRHLNRQPEQPVLIVLDGHTTHTSPEMTKWALERKIHLFVLPAHSSHLLQPLDVAVFGPFKRFYYSECAAHMRVNMGTVVTKYNVASIACNAYLKAMNPYSIVSAFRKTGIHPLNKDAIPQEKLLPCEPFRDDTPIQKMKAIKAGKEAVQEYVDRKSRSVLTCGCGNRANQPQPRVTKPRPSGREITSTRYLDEVDCFERDKENVTPNPAPVQPVAIISPGPSTSGITECNVDDSSDEEIDDSELCCVCGQFSPPNLDLRPHLKIVNWGQCESCHHWVHLSFCHEKSVLRRGDTFVCQHCC